jgi:hypothetical protein
VRCVNDSINTLIPPGCKDYFDPRQSFSLAVR